MCAFKSANFLSFRKKSGRSSTNISSQKDCDNGGSYFLFALVVLKSLRIAYRVLRAECILCARISQAILQKYFNLEFQQINAF